MARSRLFPLPREDKLNARVALLSDPFDAHRDDLERLKRIAQRGNDIAKLNQHEVESEVFQHLIAIIDVNLAGIGLAKKSHELRHQMGYIVEPD